MRRKRFYYLVRVQYLGFRYSGWQQQPGQKTIEGMLSKTLKFILPKKAFKILGAGRTDAKVSALDAAFELFLENSPIGNMEEFLNLFNKNLPLDIRVTNISETDREFNIIKNSSQKEYIYLFSFGSKNHPFSAPFMANIIEYLDIEKMKTAASMYVGEHNFRTYTAKPRENTTFIRSVKSCEIVKNTILEANFFPEESYILKVSGKGFMRYQIRMIMGALIQLGLGELNLEDVVASLEAESTVDLSYVAPGSGLHLNQLRFE